MPVKEYPGDHSWGYTPAIFLPQNPVYGTTEGLKASDDECHAVGFVSSWTGL
jgi:1,4-alpha-glucan branching enzyme